MSKHLESSGLIRMAIEPDFTLGNYMGRFAISDPTGEYSDYLKFDIKDAQPGDLVMPRAVNERAQILSRELAVTELADIHVDQIAVFDPSHLNESLSEGDVA
jgi:hypothetical protein